MTYDERMTALMFGLALALALAVVVPMMCYVLAFVYDKSKELLERSTE